MKANTFNDVLLEHSIKNAEATAYVFLDDRGEETGQISYADLFQKAASFAARLEGYEAQARIVIILPTSLEFPIAFLGCMLAGKIAVPLAVPNNHRFTEILNILDDCKPACLVSNRAIRNVLHSKLADTQWRSLEILAVEDLTFEEAYSDLPFSGDTIALLQYTSGSTSAPKGVIVRHKNIMANHRMMKDAFGLDRTSTVVGWTPLHHDQGLIGNLLHPLYVGAKCVLMPPIAFLRSPLLWLRMITKYQAHISGGPNFAYNLCIDRYQSPSDGLGIDLSSWKIAFNGAEPISSLTIRRFVETFEPLGFHSDSTFPCYGMAEATLFVSGGPSGKGTVFLGATMSGEQPGNSELVCSGPVHREISVLIQSISEEDPTTASRVGEICLAGPNITSGYWGVKSDDFIVDEQSGVRYLRTGDLGFLRDEGLYVTGRRKELMIVRGRNIYPYDIERTVTESHEHFQKGGCAVFSLAKEQGGEEVFAVQEIDRAARHKLQYEEVAGVVKKNVVRNHEIMLKRIYFVNPGFIPRTTSGKIKRTQLARLFNERSSDHDDVGVLATC